MKKNTFEKQERAKKRIGELKGFYGHLTAYLGVNIMITTVKIVGSIQNGTTFSQAFFDFSSFAVWFFWGIGLFFHASKVFSWNPVFNKSWERRQIQKYMEEDEEEFRKYR